VRAAQANTNASGRKAILARLPEQIDDWTRNKAREIATLEVAAARMGERLAAGRRVDSDRVVRLLGAIGRASKSIGLNKGRPKPAPVLRIINFGGDTVDTKGATGRLVLTMFAAVAEFERAVNLERQREGIAKAKAEGKYRGRKPTARTKAPQVIKLHRAGKTVAAIARELGIGRASVYRALAK
jgi:hypothetical protein